MFWHLSLVVLGFFSLYLGSDLINKYWFPVAIRQYLLPPKFQAGQCIAAHRFWGVNPKSVVGLKVKGEETFYLLRDLDKYEHFQLISTQAVERQAARVPCSIHR